MDAYRRLLASGECDPESVRCVLWVEQVIVTGPVAPDPTPAVAPEDHNALDFIGARLHECGNVEDVQRQSECVEFFCEGSDRFYEIVVRPIDADDEDWRRVGYDGPPDQP